MGFFLQGKNVGLRPLSLSDTEGNYQNWLNDSVVCQYNSHGRFAVTQQNLQEYVKAVDNRKDILVMAIIDIESGIHIGNISLQNINYIDRNAEIAYLIGEKEFWGKGRARESSELLLEHAFMQLNLERVYCGTSAENENMQNLAQRLGFVKEGLRRKAIYKHGRYHDVIEYGMLKSDYESAREAGNNIEPE